MSAILSADDLNDFISPGVACIKPVETLPAAPKNESNPYEVQVEDKSPANLPPAQISLTDCLACSGCVTSAEAVLVSLQSHNEVLANLESLDCQSKRFVALLSPQSRASLATAFGVSQKEAGWMVEQLLCAPEGIWRRGRGFDLVVDTNVAREISLHYAAEELFASFREKSGSENGEEEEGIAKKKPLLTSSCPGFICYLESTQPALIPHLSTLKSSQAILGTLLKSTLPRMIARDGAGPEALYVVGIMPCFDKKLEGARGELTSTAWSSSSSSSSSSPVRDVDCVITTRELISLAESCDIDFSSLPRTKLPQEERLKIPDITLESFLTRQLLPNGRGEEDPGTSGGYLHYIAQRILSTTPGSELRIEKGRNIDTIDYVISQDKRTIIRLSRCYGFRNIQNLVRRLKPTKQRVLPRFGKATAPPVTKKTVAAKRPSPKDGGGGEYAYVEVMACPGGCTNGGGQIKFDDELIASSSLAANGAVGKRGSQKEWLAKVDEAYYSGDESVDGPLGNNNQQSVETFVRYWEEITDIPRNKLLFTSYRKVENDLGGRLEGEKEVSSTVRAAELAGKVGGGW